MSFGEKFQPGQPRPPKKTRDPHPNDRFEQWNKNDFIDAIRLEVKARLGRKIPKPIIKLIVDITFETLTRMVYEGKFIKMRGFMNWGPHTYRATTYIRLGKEIHKSEATVPYVRFSPTFRKKVKEYYRSHGQAESNQK